MRLLIICLTISFISSIGYAQDAPKYYKSYEKQKKQLSKHKYDHVFAQSARKLKRAAKDSLPLDASLALLQLSKANAGDGMGQYFKETDSILSLSWKLLRTDTGLNESQKQSLADDFSKLYFNRENYRLGSYYFDLTGNTLPSHPTSIDSINFLANELDKWHAYKSQGLFYKYNSDLDTLLKQLTNHLSDSILTTHTDSVKVYDKPSGKIKKQKKRLLASMIYLKASTFFEQGYFKEGERYVNEHFKMVKKMAGKELVYAKMIKLKADLAKVNQQTKLSRKTYKKAIKRYKKHYEKFDLPILELEEQLVYNYISDDKEVAVIGALSKLAKHTMKWGKTTDYHHVPHFRATIMAHDYLKQYKKAEDLTVQLINFQSEVMPFYEHATRLNNDMAYRYLLSRNFFGMADTLSDRQTIAYAEAYGENTPRHAVSLIRRADYLTNYEFDLTTANQYLFGENWDNYSTSYSSWHPDLIPAKINRSRLLSYGNKLDEATEELATARKRNEDRFGSNNKRHATILLQWARLSLIKGELEQAKDTAQVALDLFKTLSGENSLDYLLASQLMADYHLAKGNLYDSEKLYEHVVSNSKKLYNQIRLTDATDPESLAKLYLSIGDLDKAESMIEKSLTNKIKLFGDDHIGVLNSTYLMAELQLSKGNLLNALKYGKRAVEIGEKELSENRKIGLTTVKNILAKIYIAIGDNHSAQQQIADVFDLQKEILGNKHLELARTSLWLTEVNYTLGLTSLRQCINKLEQSAKAIKKATETNHLEYGRALLIVAQYKLMLDKHVQAMADAKEASGIIKNLVGENSETLAGVYRLQAEIYLAENKFDPAVDFYKKADKIYRKKYHKLHYNVLHHRQVMIELLWKKGENKKALKEQEKLVEDYITIMEVYMNHFNKRERQIYQEQISDAFNDYYAMSLESSNAAKYYQNVVETRWQQIHYNKSRLSNVSNKMKSTANEGLMDIYEDWKETKKEAVLSLIVEKADQKVMGINAGDIKVDLKTAEKQLKKNSKIFANYIDNNMLTVKHVIKKLKDDETAIEMIRFNSLEDVNDSSKYAVIQLKNSSKKPTGFVLMNGKQLENEALLEYQESQAGDSAVNSAFVNYWKPIHQQLKSYKKVYFTADGIYHWVNPEMFSTSDSSLVIHDYEIVRLNDISQLKANSHQSKPDSSDYVALIDEPKKAPVVNIPVQQIKNEKRSTNKKVKLITKLVSDLDTTLAADSNTVVLKVDTTILADSSVAIAKIEEPIIVEPIKTVEAPLYNANKDWALAWSELSNTHHFNFTHISDTAVIEDCFNKLIKHKIVQFNGRNYARSELTSLKTASIHKVTNNSLLAGLIMQDGNTLIDELYPVNVNKKEGVLTVQELRTLSLNSTTLMVLSNMDIKGLTWNEIKFQKNIIAAMNQSGVSYVLYNTERLDLEQSKEFLMTFYNTWLSKPETTIEHALQQTKLKLIKEQPAFSRSWCSYVLVN
ncbi:MAG: hypothetical protein ACJAUV_000147 [Flavobacteriales bacterium]|jgi:hypothetical protein